MLIFCFFIFFFKQKTAYEMRISDWSSDVCSSDLRMMVGLMDALGVERADFVCNSWGGTIALCLAAHYPDRVRSLVITGSMPVFYGPLAPLPAEGRRGRNTRDEIGRASCRERVCQYV